MLKKVSLIISLLLFNISILAEAKKLPGLKKIIDKGILSVSLTPMETPIFTEIDKNNSIYGINTHMAEEIAKSLGVKLKLLTVAKDWNAVIDEVAGNKADLGISYLSITDARAQKVLYSIPHVEVAQMLILNNDSILEQNKKGRSVFKDMFDPKDGMVIGVYSDSSYFDFARYLFPNVNIKEYETSKDLFEAVSSKKVDALLIDELEVLIAFKENPNYRVNLTEERLKDYPDYIAVAIDPSNRDLADYINNFILSKGFKFTIDSAQKFYNEKLKIKVAK